MVLSFYKKCSALLIKLKKKQDNTTFINVCLTVWGNFWWHLSEKMEQKLEKDCGKGIEVLTSNEWHDLACFRAAFETSKLQMLHCAVCQLFPRLCKAQDQWWAKNMIVAQSKQWGWLIFIETNDITNADKHHANKYCTDLGETNPNPVLLTKLVMDLCTSNDKPPFVTIDRSKKTTTHKCHDGKPNSRGKSMQWNCELLMLFAHILWTESSAAWHLTYQTICTIGCGHNMEWHGYLYTLNYSRSVGNLWLSG